MKRIIYRIIYGNPTGSREDFLAVFALNINSGFSKAVARAKKNALADEEINRVEFWEVTS